MSPNKDTAPSSGASPAVALHQRSATALLRALQSGEVTAQALTRHLIARVESLDGDIHAVAVRDFDRALARARDSDAARARGEYWGPLHGLPMTVKESFDVEGLATTWGFPSFEDNRARHHAVAVQRLHDAGAIILGKTNVPVGLADWQTFNPLYGTTSNPWDLGRTPGGSSGGSAAALCAGLSPLELGSDIGASIRNPAHYCGVYGHKPTWGVLPMQGHQLPGVTCIDSLDLAVIGPMARSAQDLRLAMDVLAAPLSQFGPLGWQRTAWRPASRPLHQLRVAIVCNDALAPVTADIERSLRELAAFLRQQGLTVIEDLPPVDSAQNHRVYTHLLRAATGAMLDDETYARFAQLGASADPGRETIQEITWRASTMSHRDWVAIDQQRAALRAQWAAFFEGVDLLIAPASPSPAIAHNQEGDRWDRMVDINGQARAHTDILFWAGLAGCTGLPATAIPLGLSPQGLPFGAQIIGPALSDPQCLEMACWLETNWRGYTAPPAYRF